MQLLSCLVLLWVTFTQTTSAFRPATRPAALRQPSHCHAKKPASRGSQATQSFAVSVESSAEPAVDDPPYLETGASSLVHPVSFVPDLANMEPEDYQKILHKVLNGIILTVAFGSAIYAILNIDAGMTRGWTQQVSQHEQRVLVCAEVVLAKYRRDGWKSFYTFAHMFAHCCRYY